MQSKIKPYPETHQNGFISVEYDLKAGGFRGDLGIQITEDGRVWICIDGVATIRFRPLPSIGEKNGK